eukprot:TRINITY_DN18_c0_g2_i1.p1 TRINITY_DN18_c0_g2~~TRINITY_DN18_c0_g2_i1.p1  ORF type:complete len:315 (-),score=47.55 TRINITY_DN18_c0_g2_i1:204-1148(-)
MVLVLLWLLLPLAAHGLSKDTFNADLEKMSCPSVFFGVFSAQNNIARRATVRKMWQEVNKGWGHVRYKFVLCERPTIDVKVAYELMQFSDLLFLDCDEGYLNGALTVKAAKTMEYFLSAYPNTRLFMKIDDDTFISSRRLCTILEWRVGNGKSNAWLYAGVFSEGPNETIHTIHVPIRDPQNPWYEPPEKFGGECYPPSAKGGPGYILSRSLVRSILVGGISDSHVLNNEDKAVGVWVDAVKNSGQEVDFVNIPGTDGYEDHASSIVTRGSYGQYPHIVHHHLDEVKIDCLFKVDKTLNPNLTIDHCFNSSPLL